MMDATPLLRLYARRRARQLSRLLPAKAQERQLLRLVARARDTRFGRAHDFRAIRTVADYQARVPLSRYEDLWDRWWSVDYPALTDVTWPGTIPYFAMSSGTTTGMNKYIPVSREMVAANRRATLDLMTFHLLHRPASRVMGGRNFMLGGSTQLVEERPGILAGDLSGIAAREVPVWARPWYFPPAELSAIADWEEKVRVLGQRSLGEDVRSIGGTASWLLLFFDSLGQMRGLGPGARLADIWPGLDLVVHGGVNFTPYRHRFECLLDGGHAELREVYPASEGFIAVADRGTGEGLRLMADNGLFLEFVPVEDLGREAPRRHWLATVELGVNYAVVVSSNAGAWAYLLGDTVRFVDVNPPRVLVTGRTSYMLSAFGEHLIGEEIERAVTRAAEAIGADVVDYSVGPLFGATPAERGGHLYVVEFAAEVPDAHRLEHFARTIDDALSAMNQDYRDHRAGGFGMLPPRIQAVVPGSFAEWMRQRGRLGGQNKVPRVINDAALFQSLRDFVQARPV